MRFMRQVVASAVVMAAAFGMPGCVAKKPVLVKLEPVNLPDLTEAGLKQSWQRTLNLEAGERPVQAWRVGSGIYVSSSEARLFRVDVKSGVMTWAIALGAENIHLYRPIELRPAEGGPSKEVLVVTGGEAFVFDIYSGNVLRSIHLGVSVSTAPVVVGNTLCMGSSGRFVGLYLDRLQGRRWTVPAGDDLFYSNPIAIEDNVVVASRSGRLWRISTDTGMWDWKDRRTNGQVTGGLVADGRAVYVPSLDQRLYAFSVDTGGELWQAQLEGILERTPALGGSVVMVPSTGKGLYAVGRQQGDKRWEAPGVTNVMTVTDDHVWVSDADGNLESLNLESGAVMKKATLPDVQIFVRNTDDDGVFMVSRAGVVAAYQPDK